MRFKALVLAALLALAGCEGGGLEESVETPTVELPTVTAEPTTPAPTTPAPTTPAPGPTATTAAGRDQRIPPDALPATVVRNIDGDTIWANGGTLPPNADSQIRILQIDTPETVHPSQPVGCYGPEASAFAKRELPVGSQIYLLGDRGDKDRYQRFLRYIWKANGEFYNEKAVREGFAKVVYYPPNDKYLTQLRAVEAEAKAAKRGLWGACQGGAPAPPPPPPGPAPGPAPAPPPGGNCDSSYPDFCIAPPPPDLDCGEIPQKDFTVREPDPHRFDQGGTPGVGCESS